MKGILLVLLTMRLSAGLNVPLALSKANGQFYF